MGMTFVVGGRSSDAGGHRRSPLERGPGRAIKHLWLLLFARGESAEEQGMHVRRSVTKPIRSGLSIDSSRQDADVRLCAETAALLPRTPGKCARGRRRK